MAKDARKAALLRLCNPGGAFSRAYIFDDGLEARDRSLSDYLVNGTIKWRRFLDSVLQVYSRRPLGDLSNRVINALRLGAFQLLLTDIPPYASVDSVVRILRDRRERAYCNAVLREIARHLGHIEVPDIDVDPCEYAAVRYSYPRWIVDLFIQRFGTQAAFELCAMGNLPSKLVLRVNRLRCSRDDFLSMLTARGYEASPGRLPESVVLTRGVDVASLPGYRDGLFTVQDEGALLASLALSPRPGERVWDMCAAPGGKTTHLAELMGDSGEVVATDISAERLSMVKQSVARLRLKNVRILPGDASLVGEELGAFDRVLLDAPCSGLGVLRRNPDLRWNRRQDDIGPMVSRQRILLEAAASALKPGGSLVYCTCTLTAEENEMVWQSFMGDHPELHPCEPETFVPGWVHERVPPGFKATGYCYVLPHVHGTDGFFIAKASRAK